MKAAVCSGSCSGPNLLLFSACWQRLRRRRTMGKKPLIYSGSISGIFLIYYRKCFDHELGFSGPNLLLFSVFWQRLCRRRTMDKKSLIYSVSISGIFLIYYRKCFDRELGFSGPNLLLFSVFWQAAGEPQSQKSP